MKIIRKQGIARNFCVEIFLVIALALCVTLTRAEFRVEIDTQTQLEFVGEVVDGKCTAFETFDDIICKPTTGIEDPGNPGYWSSCMESDCDLRIELTKVSETQVAPLRIEILGFASGTGGQIQARYKIDSTSLPQNLGNPIRNTGGWTNTPIEIDPGLGLTKESELFLRLSSSPFDEMELVDKITLVYPDAATTTEATEPTDPTGSISTIEATDPNGSTSTIEATEPTLSPGLPDEVLDHGSTLPVGWTSNCEYRLNREDYSPSLCPMKVPGEPDSRIGFWSSCGRYCALTYSPSDVQKPPPTSVIINSFVSGHAILDIWARVGYGVLKHVGTLKDTTWTNATFPLTQLGLDEHSEILFEPSSNRYPNHVDLIDTITIRFQ